METKTRNVNPHLMCINTLKVYDWVVEESTGSTSVPVGSLPIALPVDAENVKAKCILTDVNGVPLPVNAEVVVVEDVPREDHQFEINGSLVTLQRGDIYKNTLCCIRDYWCRSCNGNTIFNHIRSDAFHIY